jgi:formylglycine-generating enzyme required for sulfatase activity
MTMGRSSGSDIQVNDRLASRHHVTLEFDGQTCTIYDEGSANGTFINEQRLSRQGMPLRLGDTLRIGQLKFSLQREADLAGVKLFEGQETVLKVDTRAQTVHPEPHRMTVSHPMSKWVIGGGLGVGLLLMCMVLFFAMSSGKDESEPPARKTAYLAGEATPGQSSELSTPTDTPAPAPTWTSTHTPPPAPTWINTPIPPTATQSAIENPKSEMVRVPAGEFTMGSEAGADDEKPIHTVYLEEYMIDKYEVTNEQYRKCVEAGNCTAPTECDYGEPTYEDSAKGNHPVVCVNWDMSKSYCEWSGKRLPTEAEWEKAARGTDGRTYPWGEGIDCDHANYWGKDGGCVGDTTEVGSYPAGVSPYGAYDMAGNVWEWVSSEYKSYPYRADDGREDLTSRSNRVIRGGSWNIIDYNSRSAYRFDYVPTNRNGNVGVRCAQ